MWNGGADFIKVVLWFTHMTTVGAPKLVLKLVFKTVNGLAFLPTHRSHDNPYAQVLGG
jgi:hypothetical protein